MASHRISVSISEKDKSWLKAYSKSRGISMAESIRQGLSELKEKESRSLYKTIVHDTLGLWEEGDGLEYQEKIRSEWSKEDAE